VQAKCGLSSLRFKSRFNWPVLLQRRKNDATSQRHNAVQMRESEVACRMLSQLRGIDNVGIGNIKFAITQPVFTRHAADSHACCPITVWHLEATRNLRGHCSMSSNTFTWVTEGGVPWYS